MNCGQLRQGNATQGMSWQFKARHVMEIQGNATHGMKSKDMTQHGMARQGNE